MFVLKFFFRLLKVMNSETSPASLAAAFALGALLGVLPLATLQAVLVLCVILFFRVNLTATLATLLLARATAPLYREQLHDIGYALLENPAREEFWRTLTNHSVLSFANLGHTVTLGATLVGFLAVLPLWALGFYVVRGYRNHLESRIVNSGPFRYLRGLKIVTLYRTFSRAFG